jgi:hypothetical protein
MLGRRSQRCRPSWKRFRPTFERWIPRPRVLYPTLPCVSTQVGAVCGSSACTDLHGGRLAGLVLNFVTAYPMRASPLRAPLQQVAFTEYLQVEYLYDLPVVQSGIMSPYAPTRSCIRRTTKGGPKFGLRFVDPRVSTVADYIPAIFNIARLADAV